MSYLYNQRETVIAQIMHIATMEGEQPANKLNALQRIENAVRTAYIHIQPNPTKPTTNV